MSTSSSTPILRYAVDIQLDWASRSVLVDAFNGNAEILVEHEFSEGFSGARVLLISTGAARAPMVVKIASRQEIEREYRAYAEFARPSSPLNTASIESEPFYVTADDGTSLGLLRYVFVGATANRPSSSLGDYYWTHGGAATAKIVDRIVRVYGRYWWTMGQPHRMILSRQYDHLLPAHLFVVQTSSHRVPDHEWQAEEITPAGAESALVGQSVRLHRFYVEDIHTSSSELTLVAQPSVNSAAAPLRVRASVDDVGTYSLNGPIPCFDGVVTDSRSGFLAGRLQEGNISKGITVVPGPDGIPVTVFDGENVVLPNPLSDLSGALSRVIETRFSTIHGDLNLQNIVVDPETGFAWLIDFAETRYGPTLFDLQRMEVQIITKLLAKDVEAAGLGPAVAAEILAQLHAEQPRRTAPHPALSEPYTLLLDFRRLMQQYLVDARDWGEYYQGLVLMLIGALKYRELSPTSVALAFIAAATAKLLIDEPVPGPLFDFETRSDVAARLLKSAVRRAPDWEQLGVMTPPKPPERIAQPASLVGREQELHVYRDRLKQEGLVIIWGEPGVGKTTLAARLAWELSGTRQVFWHTCDHGEDANAILWRMAGYLAWEGRPEFWRMLDGAAEGMRELPPSKTLLDYLFQLLRDLELVVCFDSFHYLLDGVDENSLDNQLLRRLLKEAAERHIVLIIAARTAVPIAAGKASQLKGFSADDTRLILDARGFVLDDNLHTLLHQQTEGNAVLITLALNQLEKGLDAANFVERLGEADDIRNYILSHFDRSLSDKERLAMQGVAVLLDYPGTADAVSEILDDDLGSLLDSLVNRALMQRTSDGQETTYRLHAIVQDFYYRSQIRPSRRRTYHRRAGQFYEFDEVDTLRSAFHYGRSREHSKAAELATENVRGQLHRGRARKLIAVLEAIEVDAISPELQARTMIARGETYTYLQQVPAARTCLESAYTEMAAEPSSDHTNRLRAIACKHLGTLLGNIMPSDALAWLQRGLHHLGDANPSLQADLWVRLGTVQLRAGDFGAASDALHRAQELASEPLQRLLVEIGLGNLAFRRNQADKCLAYWLQALAVATETADLFNQLAVHNNLAVLSHVNGSWTRAKEHYAQAQTLADTLGNRMEQARSALNAGVLHLWMGDHEQANLLLKRAHQIALNGDITEILVLSLGYQSDLSIEIEQHQRAFDNIQQAKEIAHQTTLQSLLPFLYTVEAKVSLATGDAEAAYTASQRSLAEARRLEMAQEEGVAHRLLGQAAIARGRLDEGPAHFEASLALLEPFPYDAAGTRLAWGRYLLGIGREQEGMGLLSDARSTFESLGARVRQQEVERLTNAIDQPS